MTQEDTMSAVALHEPETQRRDVARLPSVGTGFFDLQSFELMQRVARGFSVSTLVPKIYQGGTPEALGNCMIALNLAKRMNADPLMVMQNLNVIQGRPGFSSPFLIATVNTCGKFTTMRFEFFGEPGTDSHGCRASTTEKATGEKLVGTDITIKMAKEEGWYGRNGSKWRTMGQQMLIYRSAAFWTRAYAPELSMGLLTADEIEDIIDLEPSAYRDVTPARGRSRTRAINAANDSATIDAHVTPPADKIEDSPDVPVLVSIEQVEHLIDLADEVGADKAKFCQWLGVSIFSEIPAAQFDKAKRALETKRRAADARGSTKEQASQPLDSTGTKITFAADAPPPAAETPADPPAGEPASSEPPLDDAGANSDAAHETSLSPMEEAREAGRAACEAGVDFKDIPERFRVNAYWRKAWKEGFQEFAAEAGA
jgi:hypothetical protein